MALKLKSEHDPAVLERQQLERQLGWMGGRDVLPAPVARPPDGSMLGPLAAIARGTSHYPWPGDDLAALATVLDQVAVGEREYAAAAAAFLPIADKMHGLLVRLQQVAVSCGASVSAAACEPLQVGGRPLRAPSQWAPVGMTSLHEAITQTVRYCLGGFETVAAMLQSLGVTPDGPK